MKRGHDVVRANALRLPFRRVGCSGPSLPFQRREMGFLRGGLDAALKTSSDGCLSLSHCAASRPASFEAAISIAVLHHMSSLERRRMAVAEIVRMLKPGGRALITVWCDALIPPCALSRTGGMP